MRLGTIPSARSAVAVAALVVVALSGLAALQAVNAPSASAATATRATVVSRALAYLHARQTKAGGFRGPQTSQDEVTPWVMLAIASAGQRPASWRVPGGRTPVAYLQSRNLAKVAAATRNAPAFYSKIILAYKAAGRRDLIARAGSRRIDLVAKLLAYQNDAGRFSANGAEVNTTAWAILALKAAGREAGRRAKAVAWLRLQAAVNGGFSWDQGKAPDADSTAAAIQALRAGGVPISAQVVKRALAYLRTQQVGSGTGRGGFASGGFGASANVESTAWAVQAILACRQNPAGTAWRKGGRSPLQYIRSRQALNGLFYHFGRQVSAPLLTTSQAVIALQRRPFPL